MAIDKNLRDKRKKMSESHRGKKSYLWKNGLSILSDIIRNSFKYRQWRSDVFTRDNWICQKCFIKGNQTGGYLIAHHIKAFSTIIKENNIKTINEALNCQELWDINNGITFCKDCHKLTDSYLNNKINKSI